MVAWVVNWQPLSGSLSGRNGGYYRSTVNVAGNLRMLRLAVAPRAGTLRWRWLERVGRQKEARGHAARSYT